MNTFICNILDFNFHELEEKENLNLDQLCEMILEHEFSSESALTLFRNISRYRYLVEEDYSSIINRLFPVLSLCLHDPELICTAANTSDLFLLRFLLDLDVDPSVENNTPLNLACYNGYIDLVRLLLRDPRVFNPLNTTSDLGQTRVFNKLSVKSKALIFTCRATRNLDTEYNEILEMLLQSFTYTSSQLSKAFSWACRSVRTDLAFRITQEPEFDLSICYSVCENNLEILCCCANDEYLEHLEKLLTLMLPRIDDIFANTNFKKCTDSLSGLKSKRPLEILLSAIPEK